MAKIGGGVYHLGDMPPPDAELEECVVRIFAYGILLQQGFNLSCRGRLYLRRCFLPNLGLTLPPAVQTIVHLGLVGVAIALLAFPLAAPLYPLLLLLLSLVVASYSVRLSNHL